MSNEQNQSESRDYRTGHGQTEYKRRLAYERLGVNPKDVQRVALDAIAKPVSEVSVAQNWAQSSERRKTHRP